MQRILNVCTDATHLFAFFLFQLLVNHHGFLSVFVVHLNVVQDVPQTSDLPPSTTCEPVFRLIEILEEFTYHVTGIADYTKKLRALLYARLGGVKWLKKAHSVIVLLKVNEIFEYISYV